MRLSCLFFQAEDGIRDVERSRGLGDVYKRQIDICPSCLVYDLSNTIFCPIGSALTRHLVAS